VTFESRSRSIRGAPTDELERASTGDHGASTRWPA
jgi:hypothetical protein